MPLALTVVLLVVVVTIVMGIVGVVIDRSADRHDRQGER